MMISAELDRVKRRLYLTFEVDIVSTQLDGLRQELVPQLITARSNAVDTIILDLRSLKVIDSMGVSWLFELLQELKVLPRDLVVQIASPAVHRVVTFAGLGQLAEIKFRHRRQMR